MGAGRSLRWCGLVGLLLFAPLAEAAQAVPARPNILVILADDLGYADLGFQGCKDIPTPNLDGLARRGVRCTSGYVSHPFCSPTRAGLITGRYQQRFGHENNPQWNPDDTISGLPLAQATLPTVLKSAGYTTGCVGKWHLGAHPQFHPNRRGFDEYFGMLGGGHVYLPEANGSAEYQIPMDRNGVSEPLKGYLTTVLGQEGAAFVTRHQGHPWFLYLAFNAPHAPLQVAAFRRHLQSRSTRTVARDRDSRSCTLCANSPPGMAPRVRPNDNVLHKTDVRKQRVVRVSVGRCFGIHSALGESRPGGAAEGELTLPGGFRVRRSRMAGA